MLPPSIMVKFFTQSCPRCLAKPSSINDTKCLCIVKGHIVPARGYVEGGDKKKDSKTEEPGPSVTNPEKSNEDLFIEKAKKALDELKKEEDKLKKPPDEKA